MGVRSSRLLPSNISSLFRDTSTGKYASSWQTFGNYDAIIFHPQESLDEKTSFSGKADLDNLDFLNSIKKLKLK